MPARDPEAQGGDGSEVTLDRLYDLVPAAEEEDLAEGSRRERFLRWETRQLAEVGLLDDEASDARSAPAQRLRDIEDPDDWSLAALASPTQSGQWRTAVALARSVITVPARLHIKGPRLGFAAEFATAWRQVTGTAPPRDMPAVWAEAAAAAGWTPTGPVLAAGAVEPIPPVTSTARLRHLLVALFLEADLPSPHVADCLDEWVARALGWQ